MIIDSPGRYWEKVNKEGPVPDYAPTGKAEGAEGGAR